MSKRATVAVTPTDHPKPKQPRLVDDREMGCGASTATSGHPPPPASANTPLPQVQQQFERFAYLDEKPLGQGGFSTGVFRGRKEHTAIKITGDTVRHEREVRSLQLLNESQFIIPLIDFSRSDDDETDDAPPGPASDGLCYLTMSAGSISLAVALHGSSLVEKSPASLFAAEGAAICHDVLSALSYMHSRGFAHCDIKPANIVRHLPPPMGGDPSRGDGSPPPGGTAGRPWRWKLIDLDSVRPLRSSFEEWEEYEFTSLYMPPEAVLCILDDAPRLEVTPAIDMWQAGATLVEVLAEEAEPLHGREAIDLLEADGAAVRRRRSPTQGAQRPATSSGSPLP